jgi:hypothetical protein
MERAVDREAHQVSSPHLIRRMKGRPEAWLPEGVPCGLEQRGSSRCFWREELGALP